MRLALASTFFVAAVLSAILAAVHGCAGSWLLVPWAIAAIAHGVSSVLQFQMWAEGA